MMAAEIILRLLDAFLAGKVGIESYQQMKARLEAMKAEGRDPSDAEWAELFDEIKQDTAALDAAAERLKG